MNTHNAHNTHPLPTVSQLIKATALALLVAGGILVTAVLPAEHGIDPTGIGKMLGLTKLSGGGDETVATPLAATADPTPLANPAIAAPEAPTAATTVKKSAVVYRSEDMELTLQPDEGAEIKTTMREGEQFVFVWSAPGGKLDFDMHGERPNAGDQFTSYWKGQQQANAQGTFIAPFDGSHGWYWRNRGSQPVTIKLTVSGFFDKLYLP